MTKTPDSRGGVDSQWRCHLLRFLQIPQQENETHRLKDSDTGWRGGKEGQNWNARVSESPGGKGGWLQGDLLEEEASTADSTRELETIMEGKQLAMTTWLIEPDSSYPRAKQEASKVKPPKISLPMDT